MTDISFGFTIPCASTPDPNEGGSCSAEHDRRCALPRRGSSRAGARSGNLGAVEVYDGGADDDGDTPADNTLFLKQGVFVP